MTFSSKPSVAGLLASLEAISRNHPDRVLRLKGCLVVDGEGHPVEGHGPGLRSEPFELLMFRGFSSSVTHPTAADPDRPALPETARIETAELLVAPLAPSREQRVSGPDPPEVYLSPEAWSRPQLEAEV